jgi:protein-tyrosine sulfotransferase
MRTPGPAGPVFILTCARSGSTVLRYLLDAHPDLACPAETGIPQICVQLASAWSAILGASVPSAQPRFDPEAVPEPVISEVRRVVDSMIEQCLAIRDKRRFCDKSLGSAKTAHLLARMYPDAKFICLVRHSMDFIMSAVQASPWGPTGYGFDEYVAGGSGNMVMSLARYWIDHTTEIVSVALQDPARCFVVRYEDLVNAPEFIADKLFEFIGVPPQPGISEQCLQLKRERVALGDYKVWWTSEITSESVGKGQAVPPAFLSAPVRRDMNALLDKLGYARVDKIWGTADGPADPRLPSTRAPAERRPPETASAVAAGEISLSLQERLRSGISKVDDRFRARWQSCSGDTFACVCRSRADEGDARWLVDLGSRALSEAVDDDYQWCIVGEPGAWATVLSGQQDFGSTLRRGELRYCEGTSEGPSASSGRSGEVPVTEDRVDMLGDLLGLTPWLAPVDALTS